MAVEACLNGARAPDEHPAVPVTPAELAGDAAEVRRAGAFAVHVHPRDRDGLETLAAVECDDAVAAVRAAARDLPVGLSTAAAIEPDPFARAAAVSRWREQPDFVSVNVAEEGWSGIARAAVAAGIGLEAGLATTDDAVRFGDSAFVHRVIRVLVEVRGGIEEARAIAALIPEGVAQLWHGYGAATWEVISAGAAAGHDVRVGFEDALVLPDGSPADSNAQLVAAALALAHTGQGEFREA
ncbi:MAG: 3-keto-5-aminohexanoate cleavage protein [Solirubrobacteraceae bacterium]